MSSALEFGFRLLGKVTSQSCLMLSNVKEHATLSAGASVDHGVEVGITGEHVNRAADRGCCVSSCSPLLICGLGLHEGHQRRDNLSIRNTKLLSFLHANDTFHDLDGRSLHALLP